MANDPDAVVVRERRSNQATGMAGEFYVMERLYRLGHEPALTLGQAKKIDILVKLNDGKIKEISVKSACGGGKWPVGKFDFTEMGNIVFIFLLYKNFENINTNPEAWVVPSSKVEELKRPWHPGNYAIYHSKKDQFEQLNYYKENWGLIGDS